MAFSFESLLSNRLVDKCQKDCFHCPEDEADIYDFSRHMRLAEYFLTVTAITMALCKNKSIRCTKVELEFLR